MGGWLLRETISIWGLKLLPFTPKLAELLMKYSLVMSIVLVEMPTF